MEIDSKVCYHYTEEQVINLLWNMLSSVRYSGLSSSRFLKSYKMSIQIILYNEETSWANVPKSSTKSTNVRNTVHPKRISYCTSLTYNEWKYF